MMDNYDLWARHDDEQEEALSRLPLCCECKNHIQQEMAVRINDKWYCDDCLKDMRKVVDECY